MSPVLRGGWWCILGANFSSLVVQNAASRLDPTRVTRSRAKSSTAAQAVSSGVLVSLDARKREQIVSGLTTLAFFLLNFGAGYSYLMCVLAFYAPHESFGGDSIIGAAVSLLMFNQPSAVADWWGGLLGDLFWTIEPVLVLASPYLTKFLYKALGKNNHREKQD
eukprot:gene11009-12839_t